MKRGRYMDIGTKALAVMTTAVAVAVILVVAFAWVGPGLDRLTPPATASFLFDEDQVRKIYDRVSPAVVEVNVDRKSGGFFTQIGSGSGFLVDNEGYLATNNHVVEGADRVRVTFPDGITTQAVVLGRNPANDLALLKVDAKVVADIRPVELGDSSSVRPGQLAIAIGSPFGLGGSLTVGVISGVGRDLPSDLGRSITGVLQTDALINPGNSGGPLLDGRGQVVGINTAIRVSYTNANLRSIGFAVPVNTLVELLPRLKQGQLVQPAWLGVSALTLEPLLVETFGLTERRGVYIIGVVPSSPAAQAGLVPAQTDSRGRPGANGDIIVGVGGVVLDSVNDLITQLNRRQPGEKIIVTIIRNGVKMDVPVTLGWWPAEEESRHPFRTFPRQMP
jgi:S1-C subfamily serine protease